MLGKHLQYRLPKVPQQVTQYLLASEDSTDFQGIVAYTGTVISQVPGFRDWYNVVYEDEPDIVYTYKLMEDYANGDLSIIVG